jgi:NADP-dependent 3-hydroxy acid dehydrogenase YdfG
MSNKVIWITGGSSGIGKATAYKFANEGWQVCLSARREELLNEISKSNNNIHPFPLNVLDSEKCKEVFKKILSKFENIDIALFSTGIHDPKSEKKLNLENIRKIMETNFFGTINSINSVYNYFKEKKSGHVSIVSSVAGYRGLPAGGAYCASKAALINYAESLYFDMKRFNVRVSIVNPGFIKTPMTDQNNFSMPMIASAEFAACEIFKGLTKSNSFEIHFPKKFTFIMKLLKIMPNWLYLKLLKKGMSLISR